MKFRFFSIIIVGILGLVACHGDTNYATDVQSSLLQNTATYPQVGVTVSGNVVCSDCNTADGMGVVITSETIGSVGNALFNSVGAYQISGTAKPGDTLTIKVTATRGSGVIGKAVKVTVPADGGAIRKDVEF